MYEFVERLFYIALPRVRDFHGISQRLRWSGHYSFGLKDRIFPEIDYDNRQGSGHGH